MIKAKQLFFWTSNFKDHGFHGDTATILFLTSKYYPFSVLSEKLYFLEISPVYQKLWSFKCMMLEKFSYVKQGSDSVSLLKITIFSC